MFLNMEIMFEEEKNEKYFSRFVKKRGFNFPQVKLNSSTIYVYLFQDQS